MSVDPAPAPLAETDYTYAYYLEHLLARYVAISIKIIHAERPLELLLKLSTRRRREGAKELPSVVAVAIGGERSVSMIMVGVIIIDVHFCYCHSFRQVGIGFGE